MADKTPDDDDTKWLCFGCIGEGYLRQKVEREGALSVCSYCGQKSRCFSIKQMSDVVESAFQEHYRRTAAEPDYIQEMMHRDREFDYTWYRDGDATAIAIAGAAHIDEQPAADIQEALDNKHSSFDTYYEESEFSSDAHYEEKAANGASWMNAWLKFEHQLKGKSRFFNLEAAKILGAIFDGIESLATHSGKRAIINIGPKNRIKSLYRAREFQTDEGLQKGIGQPEKEIGPPPFHIAAAGRMNARGISVFYGATSAAVALSEVRPRVGSRVLLGRFEMVRPLRLLDLAALRQVRVTGSIFDPEFLGLLERVKFLDLLSTRMLVPVMPGDEVLDYLPTQVIADYLANEAIPPLDGILYPSVQAAEKSGRNVVLFHKSCLVQEASLPLGTKISSSLYRETDEGLEGDYFVTEETPRPGPGVRQEGAQIPSIIAEQDWTAAREYGDLREVALKLDRDSLEGTSKNPLPTHP